MPSRPYLLYVYPWMPYPRRVLIYLREKCIPSSLVTVVLVSDPQLGSKAPLNTHQSLQAASPSSQSPSLAIINYLDELCDAGASGFPLSRYSMRGADPLTRARHNELLALADECTVAWNPVRMFGSGAGTMSIPGAAKEMVRWVYRSLATIESWWKEEDRDMAPLRQGGEGKLTIAEIVLYQFLEFVRDCYGRDVTKEGELGKDVYGREGLKGFEAGGVFVAFGTRESARRDPEKGRLLGRRCW
ncbi:hypothetical protein H2199_007648 [Coniosporium tulheliwenetii]|uniref:Uncharacterized protein n=1 Tax=Coniosporium tulheliwenetii TaxID=3383036 RepID=A0ACC2YPV2_9PEZI|nr:hypothetical protein H2199_007648 [Cladosporium sp. JES 115]